MLWKEFKNLVEKQGMMDNTDIYYIDVSLRDHKPKVTYLPNRDLI